MIKKTYILLLIYFITSNISFAQEKVNELFQIQPYFGISSPQGDFKSFSENGFVFGLSADKYLSKKFALGLDFNMETNSFISPIRQTMLPSLIALAYVNNGDWKTTNITFGPTYKLGLGKFNAELYTKGGVSFVKSPSASTVITNGGNSTSIYDLEENSTSGFALTTGIRVNYNISPRVSLFLNPQFNGAFNDIEYCVRGFEFIEENQTIGQEAQVNFDQEVTKETLNISTVSVNAGIKIDLGGNPKDKVEEDATLVNPPFCNITFDRAVCKSNGTRLEFSYDWSGFDPTWTKKIEVFDGTTILNSNNGTSVLGQNYGSNPFGFTINNSYQGVPLKAVVTIYDNNGNVATTCIANFTFSSCINLPECNFTFDPAQFICDGNTIIYQGISTWNYQTVGNIIDIEASDTNGNSIPLILNPAPPLTITSSNSGTITHSISFPSSYSGTQVSLISRIRNSSLTGATGCGGSDYFQLPECEIEPECDFELDPTKFICDTNGITYRGISTWNNQLIGSAVNIIATDFSGNPIPLTFVPSNLPINVTSTSFGTATHDITIPRSYAGTPVTLVMRITNPTTGATKNCGGADLVLPQCQNTPLCELTADIKSCVYNGNTEVNFTANWLNFLNPLGYTTQLSLFDQNGNPINVNIPGNNSGIGVAGTRSFLVDLSNYEGQTITARLNVCNPSRKDCCEKAITLEIPKCCWDCDSIDTFTNTSAANQVGNQYVVEANMTTSKDVTKVVVVLDYFRAKDLPGRIVVPVNFEFLSTSRINTNQVNLMGSLTGFRSTLLQYDFVPTTRTVNFNLLIDNYYQKEMLQYRIKVTTYFDDGTYCDRFFNN